MIETLEYAPGRRLDVYGEPPAVTVLLWHGRGPDERGVLRPLAERIAAGGVRVVVPDWNSSAADGGRSDLLQSVRFVRELAQPFIVAGWSLGGAAAASLALNARRLGLERVPVVCLAGGFSKEDPLSGEPFADLPIPDRNQGSITLVHGSADGIVPAGDSPTFHRRLLAAGWTSELIELPTDHFGIVGTTYDGASDRCVPATVGDRSAARTAADIVIRAAAAR